MLDTSQTGSERDSFAPTREAALARLHAVDPALYASTRNALNGAVTRLSPYLTHGVLSLPAVYASLNARSPLPAGHKLVFELGWRAYYRHVWAHFGDAIDQSLHAGVLPDAHYQRQVPVEVLEARTGIPAIDLAVRALYETGYLHNHARMWLASYLVHVCKVHWHTGAQWMLGYLLDGDVASNFLSWQWVAGTGSIKPYLFNAENVAKYAPPAWHSPGTVIDASYEVMGQIAQSQMATEFGHCASDAGVEPPTLHTAPRAGDWRMLNALHAQGLAALAASLAGRDVWLLHPWSLGADITRLQSNVVCVGVGFVNTHLAMPWSEQRWQFVTQGLQARASQLWWGDVQSIAQVLAQARSVHWQPDPHVDAVLQQLQRQRPVTCHPQPDLFAPVDRYCRSFSTWWRQTYLTV